MFKDEQRRGRDIWLSFQQAKFLMGLVLAGLAAPCSAQSVYLKGGALQTSFRSNRAAWSEAGAGVGVDASDWDIYLQASRSEHFEVGEWRLLADGYRKLSRRMYANLRIVWTPNAAVHPKSDVLAEVFRDVGHGYEPSFQVRQMTFEDGSAFIAGPAIGRYAGRQYYRIQLIVARAVREQSGMAGLASARRYWSDRDFIEVRLSAGREVVDLGGEASVSRGYSIGARADWALGTLRVMPHAAWTDDAVLGGRIDFGFELRVDL